MDAIVFSDEDYAHFLEEGDKRERSPWALNSAIYDAVKRKIVLVFDTGLEISIPQGLIRELASIDMDELRKMRLSVSGGNHGCGWCRCAYQCQRADSGYVVDAAAKGRCQGGRLNILRIMALARRRIRLAGCVAQRQAEILRCDGSLGGLADRSSACRCAHDSLALPFANQRG